MIALKLSQSDFNAKEINFYFTSLRRGSFDFDFAKRILGLEKENTQLLLERFVERKMLLKKDFNGKLFYLADLPDEFFESEKVQLKQKELIDEFLPEVNSFLNLRHRVQPKINLFFGKRGLEKIRKDYLQKKNETMNCIYDWDPITNLFSNQENKLFLEARKKREIYAKSFYRAKIQRHLSHKYSKFQYIPNLEFSALPDITFYRDSVSIMNMKDRIVGIVIESREIKNKLIDVFHLSWETKMLAPLNILFQKARKSSPMSPVREKVSRRIAFEGEQVFGEHVKINVILLDPISGCFVTSFSSNFKKELLLPNNNLVNFFIRSQLPFLNLRGFWSQMSLSMMNNLILSQALNQLSLLDGELTVPIMDEFNFYGIILLNSARGIENEKIQEFLLSIGQLLFSVKESYCEEKIILNARISPVVN